VFIYRKTVLPLVLKYYPKIKKADKIRRIKENMIKGILPSNDEKVERY
jgi:hypothetical protein